MPEDSEENTGNGEDDDDHMDNSDKQPLCAYVMETLLTSLVLLQLQGSMTLGQDPGAEMERSWHSPSFLIRQ